MKIVHAADLHVDSPLKGLERYDGAPVEAIRGATRRALENLVALCLESDARVLLLAGDLFDGDGRNHATGLFFASQLARLREADVQVVLVRGNHDAASRVFEQMRLRDHVHELSRRRPDSWRDEGLGLVVHGQGFAGREVPDDLAAGLAPAEPGLLNIGLLHTSLDGRPGHDVYAPTTVDVLRGKGYDYWALGHVHAREVIAEDPWIVYPGNTQGRHVRETGAKGASVLTVDDGRVVDVRHHDLDVLRWARLDLDASGLADPEAVADAVGCGLAAAVDEAAGRLVAVRVAIGGRSPAHGALVADPEATRRLVHEVALDQGDALWVESVRLGTSQVLDLEAVRERDDALGGLARRIAELARDPDGLAALGADCLDEMAGKLPPEVRVGPDGLDLSDPELLGELLREAEQLLLPRLLEADEG